MMNVVGLIPAAGRAERLGPLPCSKELLPIGFRETPRGPAPKVAGHYLLERFRAAGVRPEEVDYYNAHGTSTAVNDKVETEVVKEVFGAHAGRLPVSSIKGALGHSLGASAAIEAAACVRALETGLIPPTINYRPDPELDLDYVADPSARPAPLRVALSASFGFGGTNNALIFKRGDHD